MSYPEVMTAQAEIETELPVEEPVKTNILTVADRCDTCGAQAFVLVTFKTGDLLFCNHHFKKGEKKIREFSEKIVDESYKINVKASASSPD